MFYSLIWCHRTHVVIHLCSSSNGLFSLTSTYLVHVLELWNNNIIWALTDGWLQSSKMVIHQRQQHVEIMTMHGWLVTSIHMHGCNEVGWREDGMDPNRSTAHFRRGQSKVPWALPQPPFQKLQNNLPLMMTNERIVQGCPGTLLHIHKCNGLGRHVPKL